MNRFFQAHPIFVGIILWVIALLTNKHLVPIVKDNAEEAVYVAYLIMYIAIVMIGSFYKWGAKYYRLAKEKTSGQCVTNSAPLISDVIDAPPQLTTDIDTTCENVQHQLADKFYESKILAEMAKGDTWWKAGWTRFCRTAAQRRELQDLVRYGLIRIPNGDISRTERTRLGDEVSAIIAVEKLKDKNLS